MKAQIWNILKAWKRWNKVSQNSYSTMTSSKYLTESHFPSIFAKFRIPSSLKLFVLCSFLTENTKEILLGKFESESDQPILLDEKWKHYIWFIQFVQSIHHYEIFVSNMIKHLRKTTFRLLKYRIFLNVLHNSPRQDFSHKLFSLLHFLSGNITMDQTRSDKFLEDYAWK